MKEAVSGFRDAGGIAISTGVAADIRGKEAREF